MEEQGLELQAMRLWSESKVYILGSQLTKSLVLKHLVSLCLSFFIYKMEVILLMASWVICGLNEIAQIFCVLEHTQP